MPDKIIYLSIVARSDDFSLKYLVLHDSSNPLYSIMSDKKYITLQVQELRVHDKAELLYRVA